VIRLIRSRRPRGAFPVKIEGTSYGKEVRTEESNRQSKAGREGQDQTLTRNYLSGKLDGPEGPFRFWEAYGETTVQAGTEGCATWIRCCSTRNDDRLSRSSICAATTVSGVFMRNSRR